MLADVNYFMCHSVEDFRSRTGDARAEDGASQEGVAVAEALVETLSLDVVLDTFDYGIGCAAPEEGVDDAVSVSLVEGEQEADSPVVYFYAAVNHYKTLAQSTGIPSAIVLA